MTKRRYLAIALVLQTAVLVLLVQSWFTLSMRVDSREIALGSFDGAASFAVAMPLTLLGLIAILIALISSGAALYSAVFAAASANLLAVGLTVPKLLSLDLSALDSQLDRLTGIANTHGLDEVAISTSLAAPGWVAVSLLTSATLLFAFRFRKSWQTAVSPSAESVKSSRPAQKRPTSTIDLWDSQRG